MIFPLHLFSEVTVDKLFEFRPITFFVVKESAVICWWLCLGKCNTVPFFVWRIVLLCVRHGTVHLQAGVLLLMYGSILTKLRCRHFFLITVATSMILCSSTKLFQNILKTSYLAVFQNRIKKKQSTIKSLKNYLKYCGWGYKKWNP